MIAACVPPRSERENSRYANQSGIRRGRNSCLDMKMNSHHEIEMLRVEEHQRTQKYVRRMST